MKIRALLRAVGAVLIVLGSCDQPTPETPNPGTKPMHTLVFHSNGGIGSMDPIIIQEDKVITLPANEFTKAGHGFSGWAISPSGALAFDNGATFKMGTSDITLYSIWNANTYSVTFNPNGGTGIMPNQSFLTGQTKPLSSNSFTRSGYSFLGWANTSEGSVSYLNGANYSIGTIDITLFAKWAPNNYSLSFNANGGSGSMASINFLTGETKSLVANTFTRNGFKFTGWAITSEGDVSFTDESFFTMGASDSTLYAAWRSAIWAKSVESGAGSSGFLSIASDALGNVYAIGYQSETGVYTYGADVNLTGSFDGENAVLVKYDANGKAIWARSVVNGPNVSRFEDVDVDSSGNVYVVGSLSGSEVFNFGSGISITCPSPGSYNAFIIKYNSNGDPIWVRTPSVAPNLSFFTGVKVGLTGDIIVCGSQTGSEIFTYGDEVTAKGTNPGGSNALLVKYNSMGEAQWARSVTSGSASTSFRRISIDSLGNIFTVGGQSTNHAAEFGTGISTTAPYSSSALIVKYDLSGTALWAKTPEIGPNYSSFVNVTNDNSGNVYAVGSQNGRNIFAYGSGVSASGSHSGSNSILVKYDTNGLAQFAKSVSGSGYSTSFNSVAVDSFGNIFTAGRQGNSCTYGAGVVATGTAFQTNNSFVKYNSAAVPQWARSLFNSPGGADGTKFNDICIDSSGNILAVGDLIGNGYYKYGPGVMVNGGWVGRSSTIIKYYP